jgi:hypothetical protein
MTFADILNKEAAFLIYFQQNILEEEYRQNELEPQFHPSNIL